MTFIGILKGRKTTQVSIITEYIFFYQKSTKQTLPWTLFISFEFHKKFQLTFHVKLLEGILIIIFNFKKKLLKWSFCSCRYKSIFQFQAENDDDDEIHIINWANWETLFELFLLNALKLSVKKQTQILFTQDIHEGCSWKWRKQKKSIKRIFRNLISQVLFTLTARLFMLLRFPTNNKFFSNLKECLQKNALNFLNSS